MWILALALPAFAGLDTGGAAHHGQVAGDTVSWHTDVLASPGEYRLVSPLPAGATVVATQSGVSVDREDGRVVGFESTRGQWWVEVTQPLPPDGPALLAAPILEGTAVQRVALDGARFDPDARTGLEKKLVRWEQPEVDHAARSRLDRDFGRARGPTFWLVGDARLAGGLTGDLEPPGPTAASVAAAAGIFAGLVGLLIAGARALEHWVRRERNEAYIRTELGNRTAPADPPA